jgi:putative transposase
MGTFVWSLYDESNECTMSAMLIRKAYRFRMEPTSAQIVTLARFAGACRWAWNEALVEQKRRLEAGERVAGYAELCRWITGWRHAPSTKWLAEIHVHPVQQKLKDLERAFRDYFRKPGDRAKRNIPRLKVKGVQDSFRYPIGIRAEILSNGWGQVWLPKIGWVRYRASRAIEGRIAQATIVREGVHWFVSIQTERELVVSERREAQVGIDLGVARFATLSDGNVFNSPHAYMRQAPRLARLQRQLARKERGSANWKKHVRKVARLRRRERRIRNDFLHQVSAAIARHYGRVVIEDLKVSRMTRSAKGTRDKPGQGVRAKAGLNRVILDQGWSTFRRLLAYKLVERGGQLIAVDSKHTSQRCLQCGYVHANNRKSQAVFACRACGYVENADLNASRNILKAAGLVASACGGIGHEPPVEAGTAGTGA